MRSLNPIVRYTILRLLVFLATVAVLMLALRDVVPTVAILLLAVVVSAIVSLLLLRRERDSLASDVAARVHRARRRIDEGARAEDAADDEHRRGAGER